MLQQPAVVRLEGYRGGFGAGDRVEISFFLERRQGDAAWRVHLSRDYSGPPGHVEKLDRWIEGAECPAVAAMAETLRDFRLPRPYGPGEPGQAATMAPHGTRYVLTTLGALNGGEGSTVTTDLTRLILGETVLTTLNQLRDCPAER